MKINATKIITALLCCAAAIGLLLYSGPVGDAVREALKVCAGMVIPALFPFMALSSFIALSGAAHYISLPFSPLTRLLRLPRAMGATVLMSMTGGYPVGARLIALYLEQGRISPRTAARMLCFCCNAGPAFIISAVGTRLLNNTGAGIALLIAHLLSSLVIGAAMARGEKTPRFEAPRDERRDSAAAFVEAVKSASSGMIIMCSFIVLFYAVTALLESSGATSAAVSVLGSVTPMDEGFWRALITGMLEVTSGCIAAASTAGSAPFMLTAFLISFSGISVICQISSCFPPGAIDLQPFILSRVVHGFLTMLISYPLFRVFCRVLPSSTHMPPEPYIQPNAPLIILCFAAMCLLVFSAGEGLAPRVKK